MIVKLQLLRSKWMPLHLSKMVFKFLELSFSSFWVEEEELFDFFFRRGRVTGVVWHDGFGSSHFQGCQIFSKLSSFSFWWISFSWRVFSFFWRLFCEHCLIPTFSFVFEFSGRFRFFISFINFLNPRFPLFQFFFIGVWSWSRVVAVGSIWVVGWFSPFFVLFFLTMKTLFDTNFFFFPFYLFFRKRVWPFLAEVLLWDCCYCLKFFRCCCHLFCWMIVVADLVVPFFVCLVFVGPKFVRNLVFFRFPSLEWMANVSFFFVDGINRFFKVIFVDIILGNFLFFFGSRN